MAGRLSDTVVNNILNTAFGNAAYSPPATIYIGLSTTTPNNTVGNVTEPSAANGYARVPVANNATKWPPAVNRVKTNGESITFPAATGSWGTITHFVMYDQATGGAFLGWASLAASQVIASGNVLVFQPGQLSITAPGT